jgi:hypothetical protein
MRVDRPSPSLDRIYQLGLWLAIFFAIFLRHFSGFRRTFHQFRSGWLCYFCYSSKERPTGQSATAGLGAAAESPIQRSGVEFRGRPVEVDAYNLAATWRTAEIMDYLETTI